MRPLLRWALLSTAASALGVALLPEAAENQLAVVQPSAARSVLAPSPGAATVRSPVPAPGASPAPDSLPAQGAPGSARQAPWPALSPGAYGAWVPAPAPAPAPPPAAPPAPPAPPPAFSYQWLGQLQDEGLLRIFLAGPQHTLAVTPGDVLDGHWRVDGVQDGRLQLTWLPTATPVAVAGRP